MGLPIVTIQFCTGSGRAGDGIFTNYPYPVTHPRVGPLMTRQGPGWVLVLLLLS